MTTDATDPARDLRRVVVVWVVLSVIGVLLVIFALGPHMPPGSDTAQAHEQHEANIIITAILTPIAIGLLVYFAYALTVFRQRGELIEDGPPHTRQRPAAGLVADQHRGDRAVPGRLRHLRALQPSRARPAPAAGRGRP